MDAPEKDPGIPEDLTVQCDAPPEPQILTAHDQEILEHPQDNPENVGQAEKKDDLEGQEKIAAPATAPASEIALEPDEPCEIAPEPREIAPEPIDDMIKSWKDAIESENVLELLGILEKIDRDALVKLELEDRSRDRTALHVAAKSNHVNNFKLAKAIFDKLLRNWELMLRIERVSNQRRSERRIIEYIIAVEKGSEKTAMELALEKNQRFVDYIRGIQKKMLPHIELWEDAIGSQSVDALLEILGKGPSDLLGLELGWARRGRTALHIAAKSAHPESSKLAKAIFDQLLESRQECGAESIFSQHDSVKDIFHTVDEYIDAKESEKTARELAEESNNQRIAEYIDSFPSREVQKLWEGAIASENVAELLKIFGKRTGYYRLDLEQEGRSRGRTALHIATKSDHPESSKLAKAILDHLLMSHEERYTDAIFGNDMRVTVGQYISAVERQDSKKTAMELAKESNKQDIVEHIEYIQKRSAEHVKIDRDVAIFEQLVHDYNERLFKSKDSAMREKGKTWLCKAIAARDCSLLMKVVEILQSQPTENLEDDEFWKCEGESGRTMLHVAAMQGCFSLAKPLLDRARERNDSKYVEAIDGLSGLNAFEMANDIIGNRSIAEYVTMTLKLIENKYYVHPNCFFEAYQGSEWRMMLASRDSFWIIRLLERNKHLLLETYEGCTVLHVAVLCEDDSLVETLLNMFGPEKRISFGGSCFPSELTWEEMLDKVVEIDESLFDATWPEVFLSNEYCGRPPTWSFRGSAMELIQHMEIERGVNDKGIAIREMLELYDEEPGKFTKPVEESFGLGSKIVEKWKGEWDRGYAADVDFNFEAEPRFTLLKFHYACKHPFKFKEFLEPIFSNAILLPEGRNLLDAQGQSVYHIMQDYCSNQDHDPRPTILNEIFGRGSSSYKVARDHPRGRSLNDVLLMKNYLQHNILLENIKSLHCDFNITKSPSKIDDVDKELEHDYGPMTHNDYIAYFMLYHVTTALKQTNVAEHIWFNILEKNPNQLKELCGLDWVPFIGASTGNQVMLQFLIENLFDLTIMDAKKRTLLHHAANPTLLDFDVLLKCPMIGHCFSTVKNVCDVRKKWNMERKKTSMIFPSKISDKDFDVEKHVTSLNMERKACIWLLLQEGVDLSQEDENRKVPMIGPTDDTGYQSWWYDMVAKDFIDKRNNFNQAASALSVVGTLVAATSYIGPLQPPMSFTGEGFLHSIGLIKVFMMSNTLAFILAMTSVIMAVVVPSLPMPQESARLELEWARSIVIHSLYMLLYSIFFIILSFGAASMVVMRDQDFSSGSIWVFVPLLIGCIICPIAIVSFLGHILMLRFPSSLHVRRLYQFQF